MVEGVLAAPYRELNTKAKGMWKQKGDASEGRCTKKGQGFPMEAACLEPRGLHTHRGR